MEEKKLPNHVVIIPDGNRRFARKKGDIPWKGVKEGAKVFEELLNWCQDINIHELSFWALSSENASRDKQQLDYLYELFNEFCDRFFKEYNDKDVMKRVRIKFVGNLDMLPSSLAEKFYRIEEMTKSNHEHNLNFLVNYGGHWELALAARKIAEKVEQGKLAPDDVNETVFADNLSLKSIPDLVIRTGGFKRLSGLFPWQTAYSELFFLDKLWPEFTKNDLEEALDYFANVKRNFGK